MQNGTHRAGYSDLLTRFQDEYVKSNSKSQLAHEQACKYLPGGNTRSVLYHDPFPMTFQSGDACYVTSLDGRQYLDFVSEYSAALFGHSHPEIQKAVLEALKYGMNLGGHNQKEVELAEHIVKRFKSIDLVRFCNSGTEANTMALAVAKSYTKRSKILVFRRAYHGGTLTFHDQPTAISLPHEYIMGEFNNIEATKQVLDKDIAAIIVEPVQHMAGMIPSTREFIQFLRHSASELGAVLIFDEVVTSRLHVNGMQEYYGVYPDMTTLGKYVGGGFSFGAFGGQKEIMRQLDPRLTPAQGGLPHSGTYNNNLFSMTAGVAASKLITPEAVSALNALGDELRNGIKHIMESKGISFIRTTGFGSLVGLHFTGPDADRLRDGFYFYMLDCGIYLGARGFMNLNFMHQQKHITQTLGAVEDFAKLLLSQ